MAKIATEALINTFPCSYSSALGLPATRRYGCLCGFAKACWLQELPDTPTFSQGPIIRMISGDSMTCMESAEGSATQSRQQQKYLSAHPASYERNFPAESHSFDVPRLQLKLLPRGALQRGLPSESSMIRRWGSKHVISKLAHGRVQSGLRGDAYPLAALRIGTTCRMCASTNSVTARAHTSWVRRHFASCPTIIPTTMTKYCYRDFAATASERICHHCNAVPALVRQHSTV